MLYLDIVLGKNHVISTRQTFNKLPPPRSPFATSRGLSTCKSGVALPKSRTYHRSFVHPVILSMSISSAVLQPTTTRHRPRPGQQLHSLKHVILSPMYFPVRNTGP